MCVCLCVCLYVIYVCMYLYICACICVYRYLSTHIHSNTYIYIYIYRHTDVDTVWWRLIGCLKLQFIFRKRATNYRALVRKMTSEDKASYESTPPCTKIYKCMCYMCVCVYIWCVYMHLYKHVHSYTCIYIEMYRY